MKRTRVLVATILAGSVLVAASPALAGTAAAPRTVAATDQRSPLDAAKARCTAAIDRRTTTLERLSGVVTRSQVLSEEHRATLASLLGDAKRGLEALKPRVVAASTAADVQAACAPVVPEFRVYRLRVPQTHLVIALDTAGAMADRLDTAADRLAAAIDNAASQGKDTSAATAALTTMRTAIERATGLLDGNAEAVLAITPAQVTDDLQVLAPFRTELTEVRAALREAVVAGRTAVQALRAA